MQSCYESGVPTSRLCDVNQAFPCRLRDVNQAFPCRLRDVSEALPCRLRDVNQAFPCRHRDVNQAFPCRLRDVNQAFPCRPRDVNQAFPCCLRDVNQAVPCPFVLLVVNSEAVSGEISRLSHTPVLDKSNTLLTVMHHVFVLSFAHTSSVHDHLDPRSCVL